MKDVLRVAYFPDSFLEVNGVAMTSNRLVRFIRKRGYPFFCVYAGKKTEIKQDENITFISLKRSPVSFTMDEGLKYDPLFQRHVSTGQTTRLKNFVPMFFTSRV